MKKQDYSPPKLSNLKFHISNLTTSVNINGNVDGEARAKEFWGHSFPWEDDDYLYEEEDDM